MEKNLKVGDQVCFMLAFGQFYPATVAAIYEDQRSDEEIEGQPVAQPVIDLDYSGGRIYHVPHNGRAQQPHSYQLASDPGWSPSVPKHATPAGVGEAGESEQESATEED